MIKLLVPRINNHLSSFELGFLNIFSRQNLLHSLSLVLFFYGATNMARKMSRKPHSIRFLRWFDISQSENRKNNRKTLERASVEPTIRAVFPSSQKSLADMLFFSKEISQDDTRCKGFVVKFPLFKLCASGFSHDRKSGLSFWFLYGFREVRCSTHTTFFQEYINYS